MSNPQAENGHTDIANEIFDALARIRIPGEARKVMDFIIRKTWGWHKKEDCIPLSQFVDGPGIKKPIVCRALKKLSDMNLIIIKKDNDTRTTYCFNKDYDSWKPLSKKITLSKKIMSVIKKDNASLSKKSTTKTTTTKDTITKDKYSVDFSLFYKAYPNKKEPMAAWKAWKKLNGKRPPIETILEAIKKQIEWRKNSNGEFRPEWKHPATWLNKGCWDDEITHTTNQSKTQINGGRVIKNSYECHNCKKTFTDYQEYLTHDCKQENEINENQATN